MDVVDEVISGRAKISVYGLGYVGLALVSVYLRKGLNVIGVDISKEKIYRIRNLKLSKVLEKEIYEAIHREFWWVLDTRKRLQKIEEEELLDEMQRKLLGRCKNYLYNVKERSLANYLLSILSSVNAEIINPINIFIMTRRPPRILTC